MRVLKVVWCRLVHARATWQAPADPFLPWSCTCAVCGRVWTEED
jgi:hypothetical protein